MTEIKRIASGEFSLIVDGKEIGGIHRFVRGNRVLFCHDLLVQRGAVFPSLNAAADDMLARHRIFGKDIAAAEARLSADPFARIA